MKFLRIICAVALLPTTVQAATVLSVDLTTTNQITIQAEAGLSSVSQSGSDFTGFYIADIFGDTTGGNLNTGAISGDLTTANNPTNNAARLWRQNSAQLGLNVWSFSTDATVSFTLGSLALTGSATWAVNAATYADLLAGAGGGTVFFPADDDGDIAGASAIGEYTVVTVAPIPLPGTAVLLGTALFGFGMYGRCRTAAGVKPLLHAA